MLNQTLPTTWMGVHERIRCQDSRLNSTMGARINPVFKVLTGVPSDKQGSRSYWVSLTHHEFTKNYYRVITDTDIPLIVRYKTTIGFKYALSNERKISAISIKHTVADRLELCKFTLCIMTVFRIPEVTFPANMSSTSTIDRAKKKALKFLVHQIFFRKLHNLHWIKLLQISLGTQWSQRKPLKNYDQLRDKNIKFTIH
jgi:hypothetical protein